MLKFLSPLMLVLLAGCAGTQQAAVTPAPASVQAVETTQAVAMQTPEAAPVASLVVSDVTPAVAVSTPEPILAAAGPATPEPYQCMLSWMKGMQDAMAPLTVTAQRCDTRTSQP